ncbi:MAG: DUF885 domain-containing protein [Steroidobacteraceae bacterium]
MNGLTTAARLADLAERFWRFECHEFPLTAILAGEATRDATVFREAVADCDRRHLAAGEMLAELHHIAVDSLTAQDRATHRLLHRALEGIRSFHEVVAHYRPSLFPAGPDFTTVYFANTASADSVESAERYLERLATVPAFIRDVMEGLQAGYTYGIRYPRPVLDRAIANTRGMIAGAVESSPWCGPFKRSTAAGRAAVRRAGDGALALIRGELLPALQAYADLLEGPLARGARSTLACTDAPLGREFYLVLARNFTTTDLGPEEIHELGLAEVARLNGEIEAVANDAGFAGDATAHRRLLSSDAQFIVASKEELRDKLESLCKRIDKRIPAFFGRIPRITYGIETMPEAMSASMPPAYAQPNPADGSAPGIFWVTSDPKKCPSYMHLPLALHEAWPGHLMHIALMQEMEGLPKFRRHGAVKYTACVEGWALYCERLGVDMGLFETPHQHYGRLNMEIWRAVRMVVDTGIHWHGWSRDRAVEYMAQHVTLAREMIEAEVDRYVALPGQALAYQIGNLKFRALRQRAEQTLGDQFSFRTFHDEMMAAGPVTLPVLEELVDDWLSRQATGVHP